MLQKVFHTRKLNAREDERQKLMAENSPLSIQTVTKLFLFMLIKKYADKIVFDETNIELR